MMHFITFTTALFGLVLSFQAMSGSPVDLSESPVTGLTARGPSEIAKRATYVVSTESMPVILKLTRHSHDGRATVYYQQGGTGSCGHTHTDGSQIVALPTYWWKTYGQGYFCDRMIRMTNTGPDGDNSVGGEGNVVLAKVADTCPGCQRSNDLDLSVGAWDALTNYAAPSVVGTHW